MFRAAYRLFRRLRLIGLFGLLYHCLDSTVVTVQLRHRRFLPQFCRVKTWLAAGGGGFKTMAGRAENIRRKNLSTCRGVGRRRRHRALVVEEVRLALQF